MSLTDEQMKYKREYEALRAQNERIARSLKESEPKNDPIATVPAADPRPAVTTNQPVKIMPGSPEHWALQREYLERHSGTSVPKAGGLVNGLEAGYLPGSVEAKRLEDAFIAKYMQ
jgi:hypothetical protein